MLYAFFRTYVIDCFGNFTMNFFNNFLNGFFYKTFLRFLKKNPQSNPLKKKPAVDFFRN